MSGGWGVVGIILNLAVDKLVGANLFAYSGGYVRIYPLQFWLIQ